MSCIENALLYSALHAGCFPSAPLPMVPIVVICFLTFNVSCHVFLWLWLAWSHTALAFRLPWVAAMALACLWRLRLYILFFGIQAETLQFNTRQGWLHVRRLLSICCSAPSHGYFFDCLLAARMELVGSETHHSQNFRKTACNWNTFWLVCGNFKGCN